MNTQAQYTPVAIKHLVLVRYWVDAAREQNHWRQQARRAARPLRVTQSGPLYDRAIAHRKRREIFIAEARRVRAALAKATQA